MTNNIHPNLKSGNLTIGISDHLPSFIVIPRKNQSHLPKKHNLYKRDTKNFDRENFILDFLSIDWEGELNNKGVNEATAKFFQVMNELINRYIPLKKITQKEYKRKYKPWITDIIVNKINDKNNILSKITKCMDLTRKAELKDAFKTIRNEITQITRSNKKNYYENYFTKHKDNLSKTWRGIKEIISLKNKNSDYPSCIIDQGNTITEFFCNCGVQEKSKVWSRLIFQKSYLYWIVER